MPFYPELGRHTPPPPPYSSAQRNSRNAITMAEASPRKDPPPPPPPSVNGTPTKECRVPSHWALEATVAVNDPSIRDSIVTIPTPPLSFQLAPAEHSNPSQPIVYHASNHYPESVRFGMPVEPNLVHGSHDHPLRPLDGLSSETRTGPALHQRLVQEQAAKRRPGYHTSATQTFNTSGLGRIVSPHATQPPLYALAVNDRQPLPPFRSYAGTTIPSLADPIELDPTGSVNPSGTRYPQSTPPSQQAVMRGPTSSAVSPAIATPRAHHHVSLSRPTRSPNDGSSPKHEQGRRLSQTNPRRTSVSVRFEPYKRRQSSIAVENTETSRLTTVARKEPARVTRADSDVETEERGKGGRKHYEDAGS